MDLPRRLVDDLKEQVETAKTLHAQDCAVGFGEVFLPDALTRKFPNAARETGWQYLFPAANLAKAPRSGMVRRHHLHESGLQKKIKKAARSAGLVKRVTSHTLRHYAELDISGIPLPRTCSNPALISARRWNCSGMPT